MALKDFGTGTKKHNDKASIIFVIMQAEEATPVSIIYFPFRSIVGVAAGLRQIQFSGALEVEANTPIIKSYKMHNVPH